MTEKKDTRVNEILEAAINEFLEKGYEKASMESIAVRANLSKGGVYHHFKSKTEILFAANIKFLEPIKEIMEKIEKNTSLVEGLIQFVADYLTYWNSHRREISLYFFTMNISYNDEKIMGSYLEFAQGIFNFFEIFFAKGQTMGLFKNRDPHAHAVAFISCIDGYLAYMLIDNSLSLEKSIVEIQDIFINDFLKKNE
jgi:AcrR family transcriptional regulator